MDAYDRENLVGWGQAAAAYAIFKSNDSVGSAIIQDSVIQGLIEGEHTRWAVTRNTGDARLGSRAGFGAMRRTTGWMLAAFVAPVVLFLGSVIATMPMHLSEDTQATLGPITLVACFVLFILLAVKGVRARERNVYTRANLPSTDEMNRAGYWQVEPDVWFNPVTNRAIGGHAYDAAELAAGRAAYRNESQQIKAIYRAQRGLRP